MSVKYLKISISKSLPVISIVMCYIISLTAITLSEAPVNFQEKGCVELHPLACAIHLAKFFDSYELLTDIAMQFSEIGEKYKSRELLEYANNGIKKMKDGYAKTQSIIKMALTYWKFGEKNMALQLVSDTLEHAQFIEDPATKYNLLLCMAHIYAETGEYAKAFELLKSTEAETGDLPSNKEYAFERLSVRFMNADDPVMALAAVGEMKTLRKSWAFQAVLDFMEKSGKKETLPEALLQAERVAEMAKNEHYYFNNSLKRIALLYMKIGNYDRVFNITGRMDDYTFQCDILGEILRKSKREELFVRAYASIPPLGYETSEKAVLLTEMSIGYFQIGRKDKAFEIFAGAMSSLGKIYDAGDRAAASAKMALMCRHSSNLREKSVELLSLVIALIPEIQSGCETGLAAIAWQYYDSGEEGMAEELNEALLVPAMEKKNAYLQSCISRNYAGMKEYEQAIRISKSIKDGFEKNLTMEYIVQILAGVNRYDDAMRLAEEIKDPYYKSRALSCLISKHLENSDNEYALHLAGSIPDMDIKRNVLTKELHKALMKEADDYIEHGMKAEAMSALSEACELFGSSGFASERDNYAFDIACRYAVLYEFEKALGLADGSPVALARIGFLFLEMGIEPDKEMKKSLKEIIASPRPRARCGN
ncbi:MAG: hypothetical protein HZA48_01135 [Planctomycetes bacterium]|nr:hypothetical protein [Planctomycetota bacterium]